MVWSYLPLPNEIRNIDQVRLNIGDTVKCDQQLQDEEIVAFLAGRPNIYGACADACRSLAAKFGRSVNQKAGPNSANFSDMAKAYLRMASGFDQKAAMSGSAMPYAGGISVADKIRQDQDTDRVKPQFNIGLDDNNLLPFGPSGQQTEEDASDL